MIKMWIHYILLLAFLLAMSDGYYAKLCGKGELLENISFYYAGFFEKQGN
jgi:hypothetical protein